MVATLALNYIADVFRGIFKGQTYIVNTKVFTIMLFFLCHLICDAAVPLREASEAAEAKHEQVDQEVVHGEHAKVTSTLVPFRVLSSRFEKRQCNI